MDTGCIVLAAASGKLKTVKFLLEHGVDPNSKMMPASILIIGIRPWTRLGVLMAKIDRDMSQFTRGWAPALTPACLAAFYDHSDVLGCLFTGGADPEYDPYIKIGEKFDSAPSWNPCSSPLRNPFPPRKWLALSALLQPQGLIIGMKK